MPVALITGITGQDGGYLAERLIADGYAVHGLVTSGDRLLADLLRRVPSAWLHEGDLVDAASIDAVFDAVDPDEVYNLAGISSVALSWQKPLLTGDITGLGAVRLLAAAARKAAAGRPVRFVQASSAEIFGAPDTAPQHEGTPVRPVSPYGAAKAYAHFMAQAMRERGLHACTAILYNHESPRRPETFVTRKITATVARIALGLADELVLGDLTPRRDWGYAPDYVDAMVRMARADVASDYIVATGEAHSVADFVTAAFARVGISDWSGLVRHDPALIRPTDPPLLVGDASKARRELGWSPSVGFADLVGLMVDADLETLRGLNPNR
jgi:GDPmannose 4,6-dehydratase